LTDSRTKEGKWIKILYALKEEIYASEKGGENWAVSYYSNRNQEESSQEGSFKEGGDRRKTGYQMLHARSFAKENCCSLATILSGVP